MKTTNQKRNAVENGSKTVSPEFFGRKNLFLLRGEFRNSNTIRRSYTDPEEAKQHQEALQEIGWNVTLVEMPGRIVEELEPEKLGDMEL